ncbi:nucleotidyltransferase domain-containing protein [Nakamurella sp. GG22]
MNREIAGYLTALVDPIRQVLGSDLVGVYLAGSLAFDAYEHGRSDIDIAVVCATELDDDRKHAIVDALRHESLPCPARGLELVVYSAAAAAAGGPAPGFEVELNTGPRMDFRATYAGTDRQESDGSFWYGIDRSILAERGVALVGPPAAEVFGPIGDADLLDLLVASLRWHLAANDVETADGDDDGPSATWTDDAVLNASRALVRVRTGRWLGKQAAGRWLLENNATGEGAVPNQGALDRAVRDPGVLDQAVPDQGALEQALAARGGGPALGVRLARRFQRQVLTQLVRTPGR